jgi:hypothetical protein
VASARAYMQALNKLLDRVVAASQQGSLEHI